MVHVSEAVITLKHSLGSVTDRQLDRHCWPNQPIITPLLTAINTGHCHIGYTGWPGPREQFCHRDSNMLWIDTPVCGEDPQLRIGPDGESKGHWL